MYAIWNLTAKCPWSCRFCCVATTYNGYAGESANSVQFPSKELGLDSKMEILRQLIANGIKIDFSGGDPLYFEDDYAVISRAVESLPKAIINVSTTGSAFTGRKLEMLSRVGKVELTLDNLHDTANPYRPKGYNSSSMRALKELVSVGIRCSAVTILYPLTMTKRNLTDLHGWLCENGVPQWDILKFSAVGRGFDQENLIASNDRYLATMQFIAELGGPVHIAFQHSLRMLVGGCTCRAAHESIGILPDGTVVSCAWALDQEGKPLNGFRLGKLPEEDLGDILKRALESPGYESRPATCRMLGCQDRGVQKT